MAVKPITTPLGQSLPPHTPHAITVHLPTWQTALRFREGDPEIGKQLKSMYPRFSPLSLVKDVSYHPSHPLNLPLFLQYLPVGLYYTVN